MSKALRQWRRKVLARPALDAARAHAQRKTK